MPTTPEQFTAMSQNALASAEALLQGGTGATPTMIADETDFPLADEVSQLYFVTHTYNTANDPTWTPVNG